MRISRLETEIRLQRLFDELNKVFFVGDSRAIGYLESRSVQTIMDGACPRSAQSQASRLKHIIEDGAIDAPEAPWIKIRSYLANELGISPLELVKKYPWAKAAWMKLVTEATRLEKQGRKQ